ncbi:MAG: ABC transporter permease [Hyphomonadaceae bacterium]
MSQRRASIKLPNLLDLSWSRVFAVFLKELVQMRRDRPTFAIMIMMPIVQLVLFGYAINTDPRHLPAVIEMREDGPMTRAFLASLQASTFVDIVAIADRAEDAESMLRAGEATFLISIPEGFEERLVRGERPQILIAADASDPVAASGALGAIERVAQSAFAPEFEGALSYLAQGPPPYEIVLHRRYNPAGESAFNIVPALLGVILTMTMVMITSIALTRETERGTMENLLATPVRPLEVMIGKTTPYIGVGAIQVGIVLLVATFLFRIPFTGSLSAFLLAVTLFIFANPMLGYLISTVARTQMQAMQMTFFIFLPSILLSGFICLFAALKRRRRSVNACRSRTSRIVREIVPKGAGFRHHRRSLAADTDPAGAGDAGAAAVSADAGLAGTAGRPARIFLSTETKCGRDARGPGAASTPAAACGRCARRLPAACPARRRQCRRRRPPRAPGRSRRPRPRSWSRFRGRPRPGPRRRTPARSRPSRSCAPCAMSSAAARTGASTRRWRVTARRSAVSPAPARRCRIRASARR